MENMGEGWMIPPEKHIVLRTSFIKMFLRCPAQAKFRYFKGLVSLPKSYTTIGTCTHKSAEHQNRYKMKKGKNSKISTLQDVFNEEWKVRAKGTDWDKWERPDKLKTHCIKKVLPVYHEKLGKKVEPILVEEPFSVEIPEVNASVTGTLDLVVLGDVIRDLKTKGRIPPALDTLKSFQGVSYWLGYEAKFRKEPKGFILDFLVRGSNPKHEASGTRSVKTVEIFEYYNLVKTIVLQIRRGMFYPQRENNYLCSPKMCGYWDICTKGAWMENSWDGRMYMGNDGAESQ